jgi:hypothetical protein
MPLTPGDKPRIATVKGGTAFPAAQIPQTALPHAQGVLWDEQASTLTLLAELDTAARQRVHGIVAGMILEYEEVGRNRRLIGRARRARLLPGLMSPATRQRRAATLSHLASPELMAELARWGRTAGYAAPWNRRTQASRFLASSPGGVTADYLFRVLLPRKAWLHRITISEAVSRPPSPGAHGPEVVRQAVRDAAGAWAGPPVLVEVTGPAGGRWLTAEGDPRAAVHADALSYLRLAAGHPSGGARTSGDPEMAAAFLAVRIPG